MPEKCLSKSRGFTIIELLVVIGIIALLVGILLPVLSKARDRARELKCAANLHTIGQGLMMYLQDYKCYPGYWVPGLVIWPVRIRNELGGNQDVFYCPSSDPRCQWIKYPPGAAPDPVEGNDALYGYQLGEQKLTDGLSGSFFSYGYNSSGTNPSSSGLDCKGLGFFARAGDDRTFHNEEVRASRIRHPAEMIAVSDVAFDERNRQSLITPFRGLSIPSQIHRGGSNVLFCDGHVQWIAQQDLLGSSMNDYRLSKMWNNDQQP